MVTINTVKDVVCPECFESVKCAAQFFDKPCVDRYGRETRRYFAWCDKCKLGSEVIQFKRDERWVIHKYQRYEPTGSFENCRATGNWQTFNDLPEVPLVMTGPGGEFQNGITPSAECELLKTIQNTVVVLQNAMRTLINIRKNNG